MCSRGACACSRGCYGNLTDSKLLQTGIENKWNGWDKKTLLTFSSLIYNEYYMCLKMRD